MRTVLAILMAAVLSTAASAAQAFDLGHGAGTKGSMDSSGSVLLAQTEEDAKSSGGEAQAADESAQARMGEPEAVTPDGKEAAAAGAAAAGSVSLWQRIKNVFTSKKKETTPAAAAENAPEAPQAEDVKGTDGDASLATAPTDTKQAEQAVQEASPGPEQQVPEKPAAAAKKHPLLVDARMKFGQAADVTDLDLYGAKYAGSGKAGENIQLEATIGFSEGADWGYLLGAGVFKRQHSGNVTIGLKPTEVDFDATGVTIAGGAGMKVGKAMHVEGKLELAIGSGQPTFSSPGDVWNQSKSGDYRSYGVVLGGYYTWASTGLQCGVELGMQSFTGNFSIMNNSSQWVDAEVTGKSSTVNLIVGYRF